MAYADEARAVTNWKGACYPTFCAAAGASAPDATRLDGVNLLPYLAGDSRSPPHDMLFWKPHRGGAVRRGDWKLIIEFRGNGKLRLYKLATDLDETNDVAAEHPDLTPRLANAWEDFFAGMPPAVSESD
jgi:arylsulfatase A-like enzyme